MPVWLNGVDLDLLNLWRAKVSAQTEPAVVRVARHAAALLLDECSPLPVDRVLVETVEAEGADLEAVLSYLCLLGVGLLLAIAAHEEEQCCSPLRS
jgi:hypothetical protein